MRTLNNTDWYLCLLHMILKSAHFSDKNNWPPLSYSYSMLPLTFTSNLYRTRFYCNFSDVTQSQSNIQNFVIFHIHFLQIRYQIKANIPIHRTKYTELFIRFWSKAWNFFEQVYLTNILFWMQHQCIHATFQLKVYWLYLYMLTQTASKVKATIPLTRHTLVPKGLRCRRGQFIHKFW